MRCENSDVIKKAIENGDLDIGLCTQIHEGGQVIHHDPVVWIAAPDFVFQMLPISDIVLHTIGEPVPETVSCFADHLIKSFQERG